MGHQLRSLFVSYCLILAAKTAGHNSKYGSIMKITAKRHWASVQLGIATNPYLISQIELELINRE